MNRPKIVNAVACSLLLATGIALPPLFGGVSDWNQWRGPNRDGVAAGFVAPTRWARDSLRKQWSGTVGEGHSSPVLVGDRVFILSREGDEEVMRCLSAADGSVVWRQAYAAPYDVNPAARTHGKGPKATPAVIDGTVFSLGIGGRLTAFDAATGAVRWRKDFAAEYGSSSPAYGTATSPLVDGGNVIVHVGGEDRGALTAFDVRSGKVVWKWNGDGPGYSSPIIATLGGVRQLVTQSQNHCLALSPASGRVLWKIPFSTPYDQNIVTPVVAGDRVIFAGIQKPTFAVAATGSAATPAWEAREITMYMSSPIVNGRTLYGLSDKQRGMLFALDVENGAVLWKSEGRLGDNASLTDIGPALLVVTTGGDLIVLQKTGTALTELIRYKVADSPVWASPAVAGNRIVIKERTNLSLYTVKEGD